MVKMSFITFSLGGTRTRRRTSLMGVPSIKVRPVSLPSSIYMQNQLTPPPTPPPPPLEIDDIPLPSSPVVSPSTSTSNLEALFGDLAQATTPKK